MRSTSTNPYSLALTLALGIASVVLLTHCAGTNTGSPGGTATPPANNGNGNLGPSPVPTGTPTINPSASPTLGAANWLRVNEITTCEAMENAYCRGFYGFTVDHTGHYFVGSTTSSGHVISGQVTPHELTVLSADANHVASFQRSDPFCVPTRSIPGSSDVVNLTYGGSTLPVYSQGPSRTCYLNDFTADTQLHTDVRALLNEYYPVPFPSPSPTPSPSPSPSPVVRNGHWGGTGATLDVSATGASIQMDCAHGVIPNALTLNASNEFNQAGTLTREGGPEPTGGRPSVPAQYFGAVQGDAMTLNVQDKSFVNAPIAHFSLHFGEMGALVRCL